MESLALTGAGPDRDFWIGQRVLLTGHTGFKGAWASLWLERLGAAVLGYALAPDHRPDLYNRLAPFAGHASTLADLADLGALRQAVADFRPTLVLHMAAQPLVRRAYAAPLETFATNVQGTANLLDALRGAPGLAAVLVVTTDKVYANDGLGTPFGEDDRLGGHDPYSASKAAAELVVQSYAASFLAPAGVAVATARAGNVIGGGDWSEDRLVPDIWRAHRASRTLELRYPAATRPWQHVLDPLLGYFLYLERLATAPAGLPRALNFGPLDAAGQLTVAEIADAFAQALGADRRWQPAPGPHPPEMPALALDSRRAAAALGWQPRLPAAHALGWTADWFRRFDAGDDMRAVSLNQLARYEDL
jgi:CDP-glucose 4,6-dehydratase